MSEIGLLRDGESLYDATNIRLMHHLNAALRAQRCTSAMWNTSCGRAKSSSSTNHRPHMRDGVGPTPAPSRGGKEGVKVREENQTVASITFQNFFRLYSKLSG